MVTVKDFADQILDKSRANEFLYCIICGNKCSANKGDYFNMSDSYVFECCNKPMILATETTIMKYIK